MCVYMCHMPHITDVFYLSLYMSDYNSMDIAMQLSASTFGEQSHILKLWHDVTEAMFAYVQNQTPLLTVEMRHYLQN